MQGIALLAKTTVNATSKNATVTLTPSAPVISSLSATGSDSSADRMTSSKLTWSGSNLLATTTYKITVTAGGGNCGFANGKSTGVLTPSPGSRSWFIDSRQDGKSSDYMVSGNGCVSKGVLQACNAGSCSSASFSWKNYAFDISN